MYIDFSLRKTLRDKYNSSYRKLKRVEGWLKDIQPEVELYLYEDFKEGNGKYFYLRLDVYDKDKRVSTSANKSFITLVNDFSEKIDTVKRIYYGRQRAKHHTSQYSRMD